MKLLCKIFGHEIIYVDPFNIASVAICMRCGLKRPEITWPRCPKDPLTEGNVMHQKKPVIKQSWYMAAYICRCGKVYPSHQPLPPFTPAPSVCRKCGTLQREMLYESVLAIKARVKGRFFSYMKIRYERMGDKKMTIKMGVKARDKVTGLEGIVTGRAEYLYGCAQYLIVPKAEGGKVEGSWFDEGRIEVIGEGIAPEAVSIKDDPGGPNSDAPRGKK